MFKTWLGQSVVFIGKMLNIHSAPLHSVPMNFQEKDCDEVVGDNLAMDMHPWPIQQK